ncbi:MAG: TRAM domain-containing protein, partial [Clostridia bacterium]|nr:TRAM domain-containing protein [Clostridia bacterium]
IMVLVELVNAQTRVHSVKFVGQTVEVLCEDFDGKRGLYQGRNEYGRMVYFASDNDERGNFVNVKINEANGVSLFGDKV